MKLESIILSLIDALEEQEVVMIDIKGTSLKATVPLDGELAAFSCEFNPEF